MSNGALPDRHPVQKKIKISRMAQDAAATVESVYRSHWGRIVASLIRLCGDFDLAEEAAQNAFTVAVETWRDTGVPREPRAWLMKTARHKAIDLLRRKSRLQEKLLTYQPRTTRRARPRTPTLPTSPMIGCA
jgi:RNA polymerase sigma-70 factor (ECF subfamily)